MMSQRPGSSLKVRLWRGRFHKKVMARFFVGHIAVFKYDHVSLNPFFLSDTK